MVYRAAHLKDRGKSFESEAEQAKLFASEKCLRVCDEAIQIHGGYGYADEFDVHRHWRAARLNTVGEGTSEIMRLLVSKNIIKGSESWLNGQPFLVEALRASRPDNVTSMR